MESAVGVIHRPWLDRIIHRRTVLFIHRGHRLAPIRNHKIHDAPHGAYFRGSVFYMEQ